MAITLFAKYRSRIFLSILPSGDFLGIGSVFSEAQHGVRPMWCCAWQSLIFWKKILHQKWGKWAKNGPKIGFFEFIEKLSHWFFLNLVFKESLYYLPYSCTNPILEIWAKMCLASQIAGFLNRHYLYTDLWILKVEWKIFGWAWSKMDVATLVSGY